MRVKAEVLLKLFDLVDAASEPEVALAVVDDLADVDLADLIELYADAQDDAGHERSVLLRSAVRRLRKQLRTPPLAEGEAPNS